MTGTVSQALRDRVRAEVVDALDLRGPLDGGLSLRELGVSSLSVVRLRSALERAFGVELDLVDLLGDCTVRGVEELVLGQDSSGQRSRPSAGPSALQFVVTPAQLPTGRASGPPGPAETAAPGAVVRSVDLRQWSPADAEQAAEAVWDNACRADRRPGNGLELVVVAMPLGPTRIIAVAGPGPTALAEGHAAVDGWLGREAGSLTTGTVLTDEEWRRLEDHSHRAGREAPTVVAAAATVVLAHHGHRQVHDPQADLSVPTLLRTLAPGGPEVDAVRVSDLRGGAAGAAVVTPSRVRSGGAGTVVDVCRTPAGVSVSVHMADRYLSQESQALTLALRTLAGDVSAWREHSFGWDPGFDPPSGSTGTGPARGLADDVVAALAAPDQGVAAVLGAGVVLDRAALRRRMEALSARLPAAGVLGVCLPATPQRVVALLATAASGLTYVPIEPEWPPARRRLVAEIAGVTHLLDEHGLRPLDENGLRPLGEVDGPAMGRAAYVIFTSGSTGVPKGVAVPPAAALTTIDAVCRLYGVNARDRVLALSAHTFDLSVFDVFGVLGAGGAVVLPGTGRQRDPAAWVQAMTEHRVTLWNTAPQLARMLMDHAEAHPAEVEGALRHLRLMLLSGDWVPPGLPDLVHRLAPHVEVVALGGATEAAIWSNHHRVRAWTGTWTSVPYGRPLPGHAFLVLDDEGRPCRIGERGELYIAGRGLADGYAGRPDLTAERFAVHAVAGRRLYRTGDLGRWLPNGELEFLGRSDRQVKVRGRRVELGEVEHALRSSPGVTAAVAAMAGSREDPRLVGFVVHRDGSAAGVAALGTHLESTVPEHLRPDEIVAVDVVPVTDNGKVDHGALLTQYGRRDGVHR